METVEQVELAQLKDANRAQVTWLKIGSGLSWDVGSSRLDDYTWEIVWNWKVTIDLWMIFVSKFNQTLCLADEFNLTAVMSHAGHTPIKIQSYFHIIQIMRSKNVTWNTILLPLLKLQNFLASFTKFRQPWILIGNDLLKRSSIFERFKLAGNFEVDILDALQVTMGCSAEDLVTCVLALCATVRLCDCDILAAKPFPPL